jgi:hypothetical protein
MNKSARVAFYLALLWIALPMLAEEATFDRTLQVSGPVDLEVVTGSGHITVRSGAPGAITVHGVVKESCCNLFGGSQEGAVKAIAANPPIEQSGNTVRIGHLGESQKYNNISISYEVTVPAETKLLSKTGSGGQEISGLTGPAEVRSGSGSLTITGIAGQVSARTGSGGITLTNVGGSASAHTGSGAIRGEHIGGGTSSATSKRGAAANSFAGNPGTSSAEFDFETGSGNIHIDDLRGAVRAQTGSGRIELEGQPMGDWRLGTGSGGITVRLPAQAAFNLNAHSSSGSINTNRQVSVRGTMGRHELRGTVNGGGFHLDLKTGSGSINID